MPRIPVSPGSQPKTLLFAPKFRHGVDRRFLSPASDGVRSPFIKTRMPLAAPDTAMRPRNLTLTGELIDPRKEGRYAARRDKVKVTQTAANVKD
jgi:hypothetical protein